MYDNAFVTSCLGAHNKYRRRHGVTPLTHNSELSTIAQKWAESMAESGQFQHNQDRMYRGDPVGENLAMKWTTYGEDFSGDQVTSQWYSERKHYSYQKHNPQKSGHFTQVVWKETKEAGFGKAKSADGKWLVVGNYYPAGNMVGKFECNVIPPIAGEMGMTEQLEEKPLLNDEKDLPCCVCCGCTII